MTMHQQRARFAGLLATCLALAACASLPHRDPLAVDVAGVEMLPGEGMELRLAVKLRLQNPNDAAVDYDGVALGIEVNGRPLARGVSDASGSVPRYGETVLTVPVTASALDLIQQFIGIARDSNGRLRYRVEGKLEGGLFGTRRFEGEGELDLGAPADERAGASAR